MVCGEQYFIFYFMKYVYLIQLEGLEIFKIGFSNNPKKRIKSLQTGNPYKLILVDSYLSNRYTQIEGSLHRRFNLQKIDEDEYKLQGEFFQLDKKTAQNFKELCEKIDNNLKVIEENSTLFLNKKDGI